MTYPNYSFSGKWDEIKPRNIFSLLSMVNNWTSELVYHHVTRILPLRNLTAVPPLHHILNWELIIEQAQLKSWGQMYSESMDPNITANEVLLRTNLLFQNLVIQNTTNIMLEIAGEAKSLGLDLTDATIINSLDKMDLEEYSTILEKATKTIIPSKNKHAVFCFRNQLQHWKLVNVQMNLPEMVEFMVKQTYEGHFFTMTKEIIRLLNICTAWDPDCWKLLRLKEEAKTIAMVIFTSAVTDPKWACIKYPFLNSTSVFPTILINNVPPESLGKLLTGAMLSMLKEALNSRGQDIDSIEFDDNLEDDEPVRILIPFEELNLGPNWTDGAMRQRISAMNIILTKIKGLAGALTRPENAEAKIKIEDLIKAFGVPNSPHLFSNSCK